MTPPSLVWPLTMQQGELFNVVQRFTSSDSAHATLVVAAHHRLQADVEHALVFFLSDFTSARCPSVLYSTKNAAHTERAGELLERQLTEYALECATPGARQYVQERLQLAEPPQCAEPDFERVRYRVLFRKRDANDTTGHIPLFYPLIIYDDLGLGEFRLLLKQQQKADKRILVLYVTGDMSTDTDARSAVSVARGVGFSDPTVHYYEMSPPPPQSLTVNV